MHDDEEMKAQCFGGEYMGEVSAEISRAPRCITLTITPLFINSYRNNYFCNTMFNRVRALVSRDMVTRKYTLVVLTVTNALSRDT